MTTPENAVVSCHSCLLFVLWPLKEASLGSFVSRRKFVNVRLATPETVVVSSCHILAVLLFYGLWNSRRLLVPDARFYEQRENMKKTTTVEASSITPSGTAYSRGLGL